MLKDYLTQLTPEQRAEMQDKAKLTREAKKLAGESLKQDYSDENHWRELASKIGFRMPASYIPCSDTKHLKRLLKLCKIDPKQWAEIEGYSSLKQFVIDNPEMPSYARCGLVLEYYFEKEKQKEA